MSRTIRSSETVHIKPRKKYKRLRLTPQLLDDVEADAY